MAALRAPFYSHRISTGMYILKVKPQFDYRSNFNNVVYSTYRLFVDFTVIGLKDFFLFNFHQRLGFEELPNPQFLPQSYRRCASKLEAGVRALRRKVFHLLEYHPVPK